MRTLLPCRLCGRHVFADESECPFCGTATKRLAVVPPFLVGGALIVATAACSGKLDSVPDDATDEATTSQVEAAPQDGTSVDGAISDTTAVDVAVADMAYVDAAVADIAAVDGAATDGPPDVSAVDARTFPVADAGDAADANEADAPWYCCPVPIYKSPPRRSVWS